MAENSAEQLKQIEQLNHYRYTARNPQTGDVHKGEQPGDSAYAVRSALRKIGLQVESIYKVKQNAKQTGILISFHNAIHAHKRRKRETQRADLFDGLATMLDAGLPLEQALANLASTDTRHKHEKSMLQYLRDRVREGTALNEACESFPDWFESVDVALIRAGQHAGELPQVLRSLSEFLNQRSGIHQQFIAALIYPIILLCAALGVTIFLSVNTLPPLMEMLSSAQLEVPTLTTIVAGFGQGIWQWWWILVLSIIAIGLISQRLIKYIPKHSVLGKFIAGNIVIRTIHRNRVAQVAMTMARLQRSGIPLADSLDIIADSAPSDALRELLFSAGESIREGQNFSTSLSDSNLLDDEFAQLLALGEESGELPEMLERIADRYQRAATRSTQTLTSFLEPVSVFILACLIGCIAMAAVLPLMEMTRII